MRLTTKLILFFLLISILPVLVVSILVFGRSRLTIEKRVENHLAFINLLKEDEVEHWFESHKRYLLSLARRPLIRSYTAVLAGEDVNGSAYQNAYTHLMNEHLLANLEPVGGFVSLAILDAVDGEVMIATQESLVGSSRQNEVYYLQGRVTTYVDTLRFSEHHEEAALYISTPILDKDGSLIGVLVGSVDYFELTRIMEYGIEDSLTQDTYMVNAEGIFITEPRFGQNYILEQRVQASTTEACLAQNLVYDEHVDYRGVKVWGAYTWNPVYQYCFLTEIDETEALEPIVELGKGVFVLAFFTALAAFIFSLLLARPFADAIHQLAQGAEAFRQRDFDYRLTIKTRDELGLLAGAFNSMAAELGELIQQLERKVADRTSELEQANQALTASQVATLKMMGEIEEARNALAEKAEELTRSNKELEQFAYVASHDLQEPLRMVTSYLDLLERRYEAQLDESARVFIGFAVDGAVRMRHLIDDLLTFSRVGTRGAPFEPTDFNRVLSQVQDNLQQAVRESGASVTHAHLPTLPADETQMIQLFQNLIANAIKFHKPEEVPQVHIQAQKQERHWHFSVQDNGIGIDPRFHDRIFVIFQRLHGRESYQGTGIGLAVSKRIVERHGGTIWVESMEGQGATFYFTLPIQQDPQPDPIEAD